MGYTGTASQKNDLGADVCAFELEETVDRGIKGRVWLRNDDGRYATLGSGTYAMVREGSRVGLGLGYKTSAGDEQVWLPPLWVERWRHVAEVGEAFLVLEVGDAWHYLDRCRLRYQVTYAGLTYGGIAARLLYRVTGATLVAAGGLSITADPFTIKPGETVGAVLRRICDRAGVGLRFGTTAVSSDPGHWNACTVTAVAYGAGASGYSFGSGDHPVLAAEYTDRRQDENLVEVYGASAWDYGLDLAHMHAAGHVYLRQEADGHLAAGADVTARAGWLKKAEAAELVGGRLDVLPHLGVELLDVVDVTDCAAGLSGALRRVLGIAWSFDGRKKGKWRQRLELGAV